MKLRHAVLAASLAALAAAAPAQAADPGLNGRIAFTDYATNDHLLSVNPDGSGLGPLVPPSGSASDNQPSWSPDGKLIAFQRQNGPSMQIWVANADGSG